MGLMVLCGARPSTRHCSTCLCYQYDIRMDCTYMYCTCHAMRACMPRRRYPTLQNFPGLEMEPVPMPLRDERLQGRKHHGARCLSLNLPFGKQIEA